MIADKIIAIAKSYVGQDEIPPNIGFKDPNFDKKMRGIGFVKGYSWCALFGKLVWMEAYAGTPPEFRMKLNKLFSPSALATYHNFAHDGEFVVSKEPAPGALVIWKHGTDPAGFQGHLGVTIDGQLKGFDSVEGNTSPNNPNERNGGTTALKSHLLNIPAQIHGLNLIGFVHPKEL